MQRLLWSGLVGIIVAGALTAVGYAIAYGEYNTVRAEIFRPWTFYESGTLRLGDAISSASFVLLGLAFVGGLLVTVRSGDVTVASLMPALLVLTVGALTAVASVISVYGFVRTAEVSEILVAWAALHDVMLRLGVALFLSAILVALVILKANRAS